VSGRVSSPSTPGSCGAASISSPEELTVIEFFTGIV
jgi:hypothetical protein